MLIAFLLEPLGFFLYLWGCCHVFPTRQRQHDMWYCHTYANPQPCGLAPLEKITTGKLGLLDYLMVQHWSCDDVGIVSGITAVT